MIFTDLFEKYDFSDEQELDFQAKYNKDQLISVRVGLSIAVIAYALYAISDSIVAPSSYNELFIYRFGVVCPVLGLFLAASFNKRYQTFGQKIYAFQMIILGFLHIGLLSLLDPSDPGFNSYYGGLILIIGGLGVLGGLQLKSLLFTSFLIVITYQLMGIFIQDLLSDSATLAIFVINNLFIITAVAVGAFTSYLLEKYSRRDFLQTTKLNETVSALGLSQDKLKANMQEQLEWSKLFTRFIRHEMENSIVGVSTSMKLARLNTKEGKVTECLSTAEKCLKDVKELLRKASDATSIDDVFFVSDHQEVDINLLLEELTSQYNELGSDVIDYKQNHDLKVMGSPLLLNQLFRNLIENAIRHSDKSTSIRVVIHEDQTVSVENKGHPLVIENKELLFGLGCMDNLENSGLFGIGLFVVKKVASIHGGYVEAESLESAPGARFRVVFP